MTRSPLVSSPEVPLGEAAATMARAGVRHLPVVDDEGRLVGILSDRDLRERLGSEPSEWYPSAVTSLSDTVGEAMSHEPIALIAGTWLEAALEIFADEGVGAIPIVDEDERVVGILSYVDLLSWLGRAGARARAAEAFTPTTH
jgi:CBS domain-containing protein